MNIGDKVIVTSEPPMMPVGDSHHVSGPMFRTLTVVEERVGKCMYTDRTGKGYLAKDEDGYLYGYNYPELSTGFSKTPWIRWMPDEEYAKMDIKQQKAFVEHFVWFDVIQYKCPDEAVFSQRETFIDFCSNHLRHYYVRVGCTLCVREVENETPIREVEDHRYLGWYVQ